MKKPYLITMILVAILHTAMAQEPLCPESDLGPGIQTIYQFFRRYTNGLKELTPAQQKNKLQEDQVTIEYGNIKSLALLNEQTEVRILTSEKKHTVTCIEGQAVLFSIVFPRSYELLVGMNKIELENQFSKEVQAVVSAGARADTVSKSDLTPDTRYPYLIKRGAQHLIKELSSDLYYRKAGTGYQLICLPEYPVESTTNLLLSAHTAGQYTIELTIRKYGFKTESFTVPLKQWIDYCTQAGCDCYIGIENTENGTVSATVFIVNDMMQYTHVLNTTITAEQITQLSGTIKANIHIYIPTHNISDLFGKYIESNKTKIPINIK